jgi:hypothetical protein
MERNVLARKPNQGHAKHPEFLSYLPCLLCFPRAGDGRLHLDHKSLDLVLESADLAHEVRGLVGGDGSSNDGAGNTASATESHLGGNVAVENLSVLYSSWQWKREMRQKLTCRQRSCPRKAGECAREWPKERYRQRG